MHRCLRCDAVSPIDVGVWIPLCESCQGVLCDSPPGFRPASGHYCAACGAPSARGQEFFCSECGPAPTSRGTWCRDCGVFRSWGDVCKLWELVAENGIPVEAGLFCRDCLLRWVDGVHHLPPNDTAALLSLYQSELCVLDRLRNLPGGTGRPRLPPPDERRLDTLVTSQSSGCASGLLTEETATLPDHVCAAVALQSCVQTLRRDMRPSDRGISVSPAPGSRLPSIVEGAVDDVLVSTSFRDPETPVLPSAACGPDGQLFALAVRRACEYGSVELRASIDMRDDAEQFFGAARFITRYDAASRDGLRWARGQEDELLTWYNRTLLGQRYVRPRGRPAGAAPVLDAIRPHYEPLVAAAARRTRKAAVDLTAADLARQTELEYAARANGDTAALDVLSVSPSTFSGWWREGRLPRPGT